MILQKQPQDGGGGAAQVEQLAVAWGCSNPGIWADPSHGCIRPFLAGLMPAHELYTEGTGLVLCISQSKHASLPHITFPPYSTAVPSVSPHPHPIPLFASLSLCFCLFPSRPRITSGSR